MELCLALAFHLANQMLKRLRLLRQIGDCAGSLLHGAQQAVGFLQRV